MQTFNHFHDYLIYILQHLSVIMHNLIVKLPNNLKKYLSIMPYSLMFVNEVIYFYRLFNTSIQCRPMKGVFFRKEDPINIYMPWYGPARILWHKNVMKFHNNIGKSTFNILDNDIYNELYSMPIFQTCIAFFNVS